jgi:anti-sigma factor RsiW
MECVSKSRDRAEILVDYCSGALDGARAAEIEKHIADCADCRATVEAQRELWHALDQWSAPEVSSNFDARLYARIAEEEAEPAWRRWVRRVFEPAVPVAIWKPAVSLALAGAVLAVGLVVQSPRPAEPIPQIHADHAVDIETVASALDDLEMLTPLAAM